MKNDEQNHCALGASRLSVGLEGRIIELETQHGSLRAAARVLGCDAGYLTRLRTGEKDNPSDKLLKRMGMKRVVIYERITKPSNVQIEARPAFGASPSNAGLGSAKGEK